MPYTAGQKLRASNLNVPVFSAVQTVAQAIPNSTFTALTFTTENVDTAGGHSTSSNTSRYTVQTGWAGYYLVSGRIMFASGSTGVRAGALARNGSAIRGSWARVQPTSDGLGTTVDLGPSIVQLAVGDYVEVLAIHTQGASINTLVGNPDTSSFDVAFLRPV